MRTPKATKASSTSGMREEPRRMLTAEEYAVFAPRYGLDREPNFEGRWHLHVFRSIEDLATATSRSPAECAPDRLGTPQAARHPQQARLAGAGREGPDVVECADDPRAGHRGAMRSAREDLAEAATRALDFIPQDAGATAACSRHTRTAARISTPTSTTTCISRTRSSSCSRCASGADELDFARELLEVVLAHFADPRAGGFYFTSDDHEPLIHRSKSFSDDATPAGNGVAAFVLQRMGYLLGRAALSRGGGAHVAGSVAGARKYPQPTLPCLPRSKSFLIRPRL